MAKLIGKTEDGHDIYGLDFDMSVKSVKKESDGSRILSMIGSTPNVDRDGDTISQKGWVTKHYKKNSVVQWAHDHKIPAIAKVNKFSVDGAALTFDEIEFPKEGVHPFADMIAELMASGFIKSGSVGFMPIKSEKREMTDKEKENEPDYLCQPVDFIKQELLEFSICNVGSNRDALVTHLGEKGFKTTGKIKIDGTEFEMKQLIDALFVDENKEPQEKDGPIVERDLELECSHCGEKGSIDEDGPQCQDCDVEMDEEKSVEINKDLAEKPFANEHSCRLISPNQFDTFRRQNNAAQHEGKRIDFIFGIKEGTSKLQAMRYPKSIWTSASARSHCANKDGSFEAAIKYIELFRDEETNSISLKCGDKFKELHGKDIRIAWKSGETQRCFEANLQAYDTDKGKWFNIEAIQIEEAEEKAGAVLSKTNKGKLKQAQSLIGEVLTASEPVEAVIEDETDLKSQLPGNDLKEILDRLVNMEKAIDILALSKTEVVVNNVPVPKKDDEAFEIEIGEEPHLDEKVINLDDVEEEIQEEDVDLKDVARVIGDAIKPMAQEIIKSELRKVTGKID